MSRAGRDILYYDGACGMCRRTTRWFGAIDWLGRLEFRDSTGVPEGELPVSRERSLEGIPMRTRGGRALVGMPAVRRALVQTPVGFVPGALMYVPGVSHLAGAVYGRIAAGRARAVCALPADGVAAGAGGRDTRA